MEIDNGASVSLMPEEQWRSLQLATPMEHSQCVLRTYTGKVMPTCVRVHVYVDRNGQTRRLPLLIVQNTGPALLGRNWLSAMELDWHNIQAIDSEPWQSTLRDTLNRHRDLFKSGLGTMKDITATMHLKPGTIPRFLKYHTVPYAIQEMVETELARMEHEGILEKMDSSPWATPLVCVRKKDGKVRLCGDYKLTINQGMDVDTYIPYLDLKSSSTNLQEEPYSLPWTCPRRISKCALTKRAKNIQQLTLIRDFTATHGFHSVSPLPLPNFSEPWSRFCTI